MSTKILQEELLSIRDELKKFGQTNNQRWLNFSRDKTMSRFEFAKRLSLRGISVPLEHYDAMWEAAGLGGEMIDFNYFKQFMQIKPADLTQNFAQEEEQIYDEPYDSFVVKEDEYNKNYDLNYHHPQDQKINSQPSMPYQGSYDSLTEELKNNLESILYDCIHIDKKLCGELSVSAFTDICRTNGINCYTEQWDNFSYAIDPDSIGCVSYFLVADFICKESSNRQDGYSESLQTQYGIPPIRIAEEYKPQQDVDYVPGSARLPAVIDVPDETPRSKRNGSPNRRSSNSPPPGRCGRRPSYREPTNSSDECCSVPKSQRPISDLRRKNQQKQSNRQVSIDDSDDSDDNSVFQNSRPFKVRSEADVVKLIADEVSRYGSVRTAYERWRGGSKALTSEVMQNALAHDAGAKIPLGLIRIITEKFGEGGALTRAGIARMLGASSSPAQSSSSSNNCGRFGADEISLRGIALQLGAADGGWESAILEAKTAREGVSKLARSGVEVAEGDFRRLSMRLGRTGFVDALKKLM